MTEKYIVHNKWNMFYVWQFGIWWQTVSDTTNINFFEQLLNLVKKDKKIPKFCRFHELNRVSLVNIAFYIHVFLEIYRTFKCKYNTFTVLYTILDYTVLCNINYIIITFKLCSQDVYHTYKNMYNNM